MEVLLVYKKAKYDIYVFEKQNKRILKLLKEENESVAKLKEVRDTHVANYEKILNVLESQNVKYEQCYRGDLTRELVKGKVIIAFGGDGTVLNTSHFVDDEPLLGVNSDPKTSNGSLCSANADNFESFLEQALDTERSFQRLARLECSVDDKPLPFLALNDLLVCDKNPAAMSVYTLFDDPQKSSGVWISTATGSTGAIKSAGGIPQMRHARLIQFMVREPFVANVNKGFVDKIKMLSKMRNGMIYVDGSYTKVPFEIGSELTVKISERDLRLV